MEKKVVIDKLKEWQAVCMEMQADAPAFINETPTEKTQRIKRLEADPEAWFVYYFPIYCTSEPAEFHKCATKRLLKNAEWYEVRAWSRELAKSARAMMEFVYLAMTKRNRNILLVSNSNENACRLLLPFKTCFEANKRLIADYGEQVTYGKWEQSEFTIQRGCSFRALGWGQSPRGTRKDNVRPDGIIIDDIDTDEECRNEDIMMAKINWIEQALIGTRSISNPIRILVNGNIIHEKGIARTDYRPARRAFRRGIRNLHGKGQGDYPLLRGQRGPAERHTARQGRP